MVGRFTFWNAATAAWYSVHCAAVKGVSDALVAGGFELVLSVPLLPPHPAANAASSTTTSTDAGSQALDSAVPLARRSMRQPYPAPRRRTKRGDAAAGAMAGVRPLSCPDRTRGADPNTASPGASLGDTRLIEPWPGSDPCHGPFRR